MFNAAEKIFRRKALERLSTPEQLDRLVDVGARRSWIPLGIAVLAVLSALGWSMIATIPVEVEGRGVFIRSELPSGATAEGGTSATDRGEALYACVAFFSSTGGSRLKTSMPALLTPEGPRGERLGAIRAVVARVHPAPIRPEEAAALVGNLDIANRLPISEQPIAATLRFDASAEARAPFGKAKAAGSSIDLAAGTTVRVRVVIEERRAISYLFESLFGPGGR